MAVRIPNPMRRLALILLSAGLAAQPRDIVVYGGTSAGVMAAVQAAREGRSVLLVSPDRHLGGLTSNGLGWTDAGNTRAIGGLAREFYRRVWDRYRNEEAWNLESREAFRSRPGARAALDDANRTMWVFEPRVAEAIFEELVREHRVEVWRDAWLDRDGGVSRQAGRIVALRLLDGRTVEGRMFVDATYEGDLMAAAGVSHTVGREPNARHGESLNGVQMAAARHHQFQVAIDPYVRPGDPSSGLLPGVSTEPVAADGSGDAKVQAYNFRVCLTRVPSNRVPFPKPEGYDPARYELLARTLEAGQVTVLGKFDPIPNGKTDTNNHGPVSTDHIGANHDYPTASYARRREIAEDHRRYQQGLHYFLANDARVPAKVREAYAQWGLARDEFADNGNWPRQLYVREARRMVSDFVMTENHVRRRAPSPRPVGMGSYNMDSHHVQRVVVRGQDGRASVRNEGDVQVSPGGPYPIDYGAITPRESECANLLVPVCLSATHIAHGSIRMEPVFMVLGQSAATAAGLALEDNCAVQAVPYPRLRERLKRDGQVLELPAATGR